MTKLKGSIKNEEKEKKTAWTM